MLAYLTIILMAANDIQPNPGPMHHQETIYLCGTCDCPVTWEHRAIACDSCDQWYHVQCQDVHTRTYNLLHDSAVAWDCIICNRPNFSSICYDLPSATSNRFETLSSLSTSDNSSLMGDIMSPTRMPDKPTHSSTPDKKKHTSQNSKPLRFLNVNFQSIKKKQAQVIHLIDSMKPDVVIGTETWLDSTIRDSEFFPAGYKLYRKDRVNQGGGGVLIAVTSRLLSSEVIEFDTDCEMVWCKIQLVGQKTLYVCSYYNPLTSNEKGYLELDKSLKLTKSVKNAVLIVGGDFNLPGWDWKNHLVKPGAPSPHLHHFVGDVLDDNSLVQLVEFPTRGENTLDLVATNFPAKIPRVDPIPGISDHSAVFFEVDVCASKSKQKPRNIPLYGKAKWESMASEVSNLGSVITDMFIRDSPVEDMWNHFKSGILKSIEDHIPHKLTKTKQDVPWINGDLRKLIRKRDRAHKKKQKSKSPKDAAKFKKLKAEAQRQLRRSYWDYVEEIVEPNPEQPGNKRFYSFIKHRRCDNKDITSLKKDGILYTEDKDKANILNKQFQDAFSKPIQYTKDEFQRRCPMPTTAYPNMEPIVIDENGVEKLLRDLKPNKASGPDGISPRVLKQLSREIAPIVTIIFRKSLSSGVVPSDWKSAYVAPVFKKGRKYDAINYRPISLTSICCKIMEHIVVSHIMNHGDRHSILYKLQHGFRRCLSCETQLIDFVDDITKNLDDNKQTDIIVMDFAKAFDKVNHSLLLHKLDHYGIRGEVNRWLESFLTNRSQQVVVGGEKSDSVPVGSGVPQGSVLGPSLFLFYINDIQARLHSKVRLFADDTIIYLVITSPADAAKLQEDLDLLSLWEERWMMSFHPDKCTVLTVTKKRKPTVSKYTLHGHTLEHVDCAKYLGIHLDSKLNWHHHVQSVCKKANGMIGFLRRNLNIASTSVKSLAYMSLVRPTIEYASAAWDPFLDCDITRIEKVQRRAARYVLNRYHNTSSVTNMLNILNWPTLQDRRCHARLTMLYKIANGLISLDSANQLIHATRSTRRSHTMAFQHISSRTDARKYSFYPRTVKAWNNLPHPVATAESLEIFKALLSDN